MLNSNSILFTLKKIMHVLDVSCCTKNLVQFIVCLHLKKMNLEKIVLLTLYFNVRLFLCQFFSALNPKYLYLIKSKNFLKSYKDSSCKCAFLETDTSSFYIFSVSQPLFSFVLNFGL